jgi:hypothetical protein
MRAAIALLAPPAALGAARHSDTANRGGQAGTPIPEVTGPIPVTGTSRPFRGENIDLGAFGYTLDEYSRAVAGASSDG